MIALLISVLWALIYVAIVCLIIWVILWAITAITGVALPARAVQLIWVIAALICLIIVLSLVAGMTPPLMPRVR